MSSSLSNIKDGKRCWSEEGIHIIQSRLDQDDSRAKFIDLKGLLEESLCAVGFEKKYELNSTDCEWEIKTERWEATVSLRIGFGDENIYCAINGKYRPLRDLFPLWGILRSSFGQRP